MLSAVIIFLFILSVCSQTNILTVISGVKTTDVTDAANPLIHLFLSISHQVEDTIKGLYVKYEAVLQVLLVKRQSSINLRQGL